MTQHSETPRVRFVELYEENKKIEREFLNQAKQMIQNSHFVQGQEVLDFESSFAHFLGAGEVIGCRSGFDALEIALRSLELPSDSEVILPAQTFIATAFSVMKAGLHPVLADVHPQSALLDYDDMIRRWSSRTRVILPVHLYGQGLSLKPFLKFAEEKQIKVVEDAAQAHGAQIGSHFAGTLGDLGCFSFYPSKNLGAFGQAGAITTHHKTLATRCRAIRELGGIHKNQHEQIGWNARLDPLQAAALKMKLRLLEENNESRKKVAQRYLHQLKELDDIILPFPHLDQDHVYHLFVILLPHQALRDSLRRFLNERGIDSGIHYPTPIHLQKAMSFLGHRLGDFPHAEKFSSCGLSLPMHPFLKTDAIDRVCQAIAEFRKWHFNA